MKKVILGLFILLISLSFSKDLDKYESKRVFDKSMRFILEGNYETIKKDKEMTRVVNNIGDISNNTFTYARPILKDNRYEVVDVKETGNTSILTVRARYKIYKNVSIEESEKIMDGMEKELNKFDEEAVLSYMENVQKLLDKTVKNKETMKVENIKVYMKKEAGFWDMDSMKNEELLTTLFSVIDSLRIY